MSSFIAGQPFMADRKWPRFLRASSGWPPRCHPRAPPWSFADANLLYWVIQMALDLNFNRTLGGASTGSPDSTIRLLHYTSLSPQDIHINETWREHITSWGLEMSGLPARSASKHQTTGTTFLLSASGASPKAWTMSKSVQASWRIWRILKWQRTFGFYAIVMTDLDILFK